MLQAKHNETLNVVLPLLNVAANMDRSGLAKRLPSLLVSL